jgi:hypothetical protein
MAMPKSPDPLAQAKNIMAAMLKLPPKQHAEMKIGKKNQRRGKRLRQRKKRRA